MAGEAGTYNIQKTIIPAGFLQRQKKYSTFENSKTYIFTLCGE
jgi:hypothetical protein